MTSTTHPGGYAPSRSPAALLGAIGIPAGFGLLLAAGLAVTVVIDPKPDNPDTVFYKDDKVVIPPKPPQQQEERVIDPVVTEVVKPVDNVIVVPDTPLSFDSDTSFVVKNLPDMPLGPIATPNGLGTEVVPDPTPTFPPVSALPRNEPGNWITTRDYRSTWIRQEMTGIARFTLTIDTSGRVTDCAITRSTSHAALDEATCKLITRRARFEPARDNAGNLTTGTYRSSIRWNLPD